MPTFIQIVIAAGAFMIVAFLWEISRDLKAMRQKLHEVEWRMAKAQGDLPGQNSN